MIRAGRVSVDGEVVSELGTKVDPRTAQIRVDGAPLRVQALRYVLLNKPRGYITTTSDERDRRTVMELVSSRERIYPVGRLDRDTEGLLLLTNDGDVANRVMHPRYGMTKEYHVLTLSRPTAATLQRIRDGVVVDGKRVVPEEFRLLRESRDGLMLTITLAEGINRVVRRLMETVGIPVERLRRVRIGPLSIAGIAVGEWRDLSPGELRTLLEALRLDRDEAATASAARPAQRPSPVRARAKRGGPRRDREREQAVEGDEQERPAAGTRRRDRARPAPTRRGRQAQAKAKFGSGRGRTGDDRDRGSERGSGSDETGQRPPYRGGRGREQPADGRSRAGSPRRDGRREEGDAPSFGDRRGAGGERRDARTDRGAAGGGGQRERGPVPGGDRGRGKERGRDRDRDRERGGDPGKWVPPPRGARRRGEPPAPGSRGPEPTKQRFPAGGDRAERGGREERWSPPEQGRDAGRRPERPERPVRDERGERGTGGDDRGGDKQRGRRSDPPRAPRRGGGSPDRSGKRTRRGGG